MGRATAEDECRRSETVPSSIAIIIYTPVLGDYGETRRGYVTFLAGM